MSDNGLSYIGVPSIAEPHKGQPCIEPYIGQKQMVREKHGGLDSSQKRSIQIGSEPFIS